jgi:tRNA(Ile2) C34 agmatinyltransferase TiaS
VTLLKRLWSWLVDPLCESCGRGTAVRGGVLCPPCGEQFEQSLKKLLKGK